ncbi:MULTISPECIES: hypothetical protein [Flavobacterium]|uniref:Uncharacterized protein n=1 Tax=Flavobacterium anhuiense TaxID=459526 RepID=A0A444W5A7_9FLAO|nr:hypothetical protein [Flavobacterium anhuiense]RYJ41071.1 hypothetical protein NU08_0508 [Flavobacterium anhuiense]
MTNQNTNKNENNQPDTIQNQFEISSVNKIDLEYIPRLYGMSLEQYKEGLEIHCKCFNQMEKVKRIVH